MAIIVNEGTSIELSYEKGETFVIGNAGHLFIQDADGKSISVHAPGEWKSAAVVEAV
ncbi:hypothetical protein [Cellulosimicrobium cellulans]|uniref:hypothetical protein n=1 Tax=Cellulosimicrobium cellulans TaxID=1710 RepID=UPI002405BB9B|nr:hypothetical protein [Cellulosimicrobium cellulans]MDF9877459.1 hypothetical protein [Cellulosimicrobium cellulans]